MTSTANRAALDNDTDCTVSAGDATVSNGDARAEGGLLTFSGASVAAAAGRQVALNVSCNVPSISNKLVAAPPNGTQLVVALGSCALGWELSTDSGQCKQCRPNQYSIDGLTCNPCPLGASCTATTLVKEGNQISVVSTGVAYPKTQEGYWLFERQSSQHDAATCALLEKGSTVCDRGQIRGGWRVRRPQGPAVRVHQWF